MRIVAGIEYGRFGLMRGSLAGSSAGASREQNAGCGWIKVFAWRVMGAFPETFRTTQIRLLEIKPPQWLFGRLDSQFPGESARGTDGRRRSGTCANNASCNLIDPFALRMTATNPNYTHRPPTPFHRLSAQKHYHLNLRSRVTISSNYRPTRSPPIAVASKYSKLALPTPLARPRGL